jgi:hypothetical protein
MGTLMLAWSLSAIAAGSQNACLIEGSFTDGTTRTVIKDCMQSDGGADEALRGFCEIVGGKSILPGQPPTTLTYIAACPSGAQAICQHVYGSPLSAYYYLRDDASLQRTRKSCEAQRGTWKDPR